MSLLDRLLNRLGLGFDFEFDSGARPFDSITATVTLGSRPRPEQVALLHELGITHVVSCLDAGERPRVKFLGEDFDTLFLPLRDEVGQDITASLPGFFEFMTSAGEGRVLVHCQAGVSRSAALVTAMVMRAERLRFFEAYQAVRARRPQVLPNIGFASQLQRFEHDLFPEAREGHASLTRYLHEVCKVPAEIELLQQMLEGHDYSALRAIRAIFGDDVPRVIQGVRL